MTKEQQEYYIKLHAEIMAWYKSKPIIFKIRNYK